MNEQPKIDLDQIDLLAENELDLAQRTKLLDQLDHIPGGWKYLALTLLETNSLKRSISAIAFESKNAQQRNEKTANDDPAELSHLGKNWDSSNAGQHQAAQGKLSVAGARRARVGEGHSLAKMATALAGSVLVALGVGISLGVLLSGSIGKSGGSVANTKTNSPAQANDLNLDNQPNSPLNIDNSTQVGSSKLALLMAQKDPATMRQFDVDLKAMGISDIELVAFYGTQENNRPRVYPVFKSDELAAELSNTVAPSVPREMAIKLRRDGWLVRSQKQILSIPSPDGNRKIVPVGMLNYQYIGKTTY